MTDCYAPKRWQHSPSPNSKNTPYYFYPCFLIGTAACSIIFECTRVVLMPNIRYLSYLRPYIITTFALISDLPTWYSQMTRLTEQERRIFHIPIYAAFLSERRHWKDFSNHYRPILDTIRLVKLWKHKILKPCLSKSPDTFSSLSPKLLTRYAWERAGSSIEIDLLSGFRATLETMANLSVLRHYWTDYYNTSIAEESFQQLRCIEKTRWLIIS